MKNKTYTLPLLFCLLTACISQSLPPANVYTISPEWDNPTIKQSLSNELVIKLAPVRATQEFTGTQIFYKDSQYERNSYAYSRWNDSPVRLLLTLFHVGIENSGLFKAMVPSTSVSKADLLLESTLLEFSHHIKSNDRSEGVVRVRFYLIDNRSKRVISTKEFVSRVGAITENAHGGVDALNKATINIAKQLVNWLAEMDDY